MHQYYSLKTETCHDDNLVITGDTWGIFVTTLAPWWLPIVSARHWRLTNGQMEVLVQGQAITWTTDDLLSTELSRTNFTDTGISGGMGVDIKIEYHSRLVRE